MKLEEAEALQSGSTVRVLQTAESPYEKIPGVVKGEILTFISLAETVGWAFCMKSNFKQGNFPLTNLEVATQSPSTTQCSPSPPQCRPSPPQCRPSPQTPSLTPPCLPPRPGQQAKKQSQLHSSEEDPSEYENPDDDPDLGTYMSKDFKRGTDLNSPGIKLPPRLRDTKKEKPLSRSTSTAGSSVPALYESGEYICIKATRENELYSGLRARVGDIITVLKIESHDVIFGQCLQTMEKGPISMEFLRLTTPLDMKPWYVGKKSREEADELLRGLSNTFLVRGPQSAFVLSMSGSRPGDPVRHRLIQNEDNHIFAWQGHRFKNIDDLVSEHVKLPNEKNIGKPYNKFPNKPSVSGSPSHEKTNKSYPELQRWFIQEKKIKFDKVLGKGNYGKVNMATLTDINMIVAVKTFKAGAMNVDDFANEAIAMKNLRHPNIVKLFGISEMSPETQSVFIVMEYIPNGSVKDYFTNHGSQPLSLPQKAVIAKNVVSGMEYLSSLNYIHRDLAARNVLLASNLTAKVADFGLAKCMTNSRASALDSRMPWKWSAPEVIAGNKDWSTKCDVWSYGVFCWELYTDGGNPYGGIKESSTLLSKLEDGTRLVIPEKCPKVMQTVMKNCWVMQTGNRTDFRKIEGHLKKIK